MDYSYIKEKVQNEKVNAENAAANRYITNEAQLVEKACDVIMEQITKAVENFYRATSSEVEKQFKRYKHYNGIYKPSFFSSDYKYKWSVSHMVISIYDNADCYSYDGWNYKHIFYIPPMYVDRFIGKINTKLAKDKIHITRRTNHYLDIDANLGAL